LIYSCPAGFAPTGTVLVARQAQDDGVVSASSQDFADQIVCEGQDIRLVVRVHRVQDFNTSDRITLITDFSTNSAEGEYLGGDDAQTVRPSVAPNTGTMLAAADITRVALKSTGAIRVHFLYWCPSSFRALHKRSRVFVNQPDPNSHAATLHIADLIVCDGTTHIASARVPTDEGSFDAASPIHALVDIAIARRTGAILLLGNGKSFLVESPS
jgi:hypothetical protein